MTGPTQILGFRWLRGMVSADGWLITRADYQDGVLMNISALHKHGPHAHWQRREDGGYRQHDTRFNETIPVGLAPNEPANDGACLYLLGVEAHRVTSCLEVTEGGLGETSLVWCDSDAPSSAPRYVSVAECACAIAATLNRWPRFA